MNSKDMIHQLVMDELDGIWMDSPDTIAEWFRVHMVEIKKHMEEK